MFEVKASSSSLISASLAWWTLFTSADIADGELVFIQRPRFDKVGTAQIDGLRKWSDIILEMMISR